MKITYAITVCDEHNELDALLYFLKEVLTSDDDISVLVDTTRVTDDVRKVISDYPDISVHERAFDHDFSAHRNYHIDQCKGDYIFELDADEIPQESLLITIRDVISRSGGEIIYVPRMNITPGWTQKWLKSREFPPMNNDAGFINWPDMQGRIHKNIPEIRWEGKIHEKLTGTDNCITYQAIPTNAIVHVKSVKRGDRQGEFYLKNYEQ
jgi:glycosyltransferase involved in cell wall biosynthesis